VSNLPANQPSSRGRRIPLLALWIGPLVFLLLFFFYPLGSILKASFARSQSGWAAPFLLVFSNPYFLKVLGFTFWQAALSTALTLLVGLPGAYLLARYNFKGKSFIRALTGIPFVLPTLVVAAAFEALLGPRGWANLGLMNLFDLAEPPIHFTNTLLAILAAHVFYNTTIVLRTVGDFWAHLDPRLGQVAETLGATPGQVSRHITLPLLWPAIAAASLLVFMFDFTSFGVILILGGPRFATLEVEIFYQTVSLFNLPLAGVLALIQLACSLGLTILYTRLTSRLTQPINLRPQQVTQRRLTSGRSRVLAGAMVIILLGLMTTPLLALAIRSITRLESRAVAVRPENADVGQSGLTLDYYRELTVNRRQSLFYTSPATTIAISLGYAGITVILSLLLGIPAAWALARDGQNRLNRWLDPLLMLPLGASAVTLGLGFILALDRPPLDLRASPLLIPLAHTLVAFPFVVRNLAPALRSIRPRLRQAAQVLGAPPWTVFRQVDLPLAGRAVLAAATFAFTISIGEFGATALVARPEYPTITVAIYRLLGQPGALNYGQALALSTILMTVTGLGLMVIERLRMADIGEF
jgi:thiamine transport system permease protein